MTTEREYRPASYFDPQVPNYNLSRIGDLIPEILDKGKRQSNIVEKPGKDSLDGDQKSRRRLFPTNSERMNRALTDLGPSAFKIHMLLWQWRGAPAKGNLPYFTVYSLSKFCSLTRPTVRSGLRELVDKGWIQKQGYNKHKKNELYKLIPIRDIQKV